MGQIRTRTRRALYGAFAALILLVNYAVSGLVVWITIHIGLWAFPLFFGLGMGMVALVFTVVPLTEYGAWTKHLPSWGRNALVWLRHAVAIDEAKFSQGRFWPRIRKWGAFWFIFAATMILSPLVGAFVARYLKLPERKAWAYAATSVALMVAIFTSLYLGVLGPIIAWVQKLL